MTYRPPWESVEAFVTDCLAFEPGSVIPKRALYEEFIEYCRRMRLPSVSMMVFGQMLLGCVPQTRSERRYVNGKQAWCWIDVAFKTSETK